MPYPVFPFQVQLLADRFKPNMFAGGSVTIGINSGLLTFVGPNGSGKTSVLKALRDQFRDSYTPDVVRYLSAGRMGVLEGFRSDNYGIGGGNPDETSSGQQHQIANRKKSETVTGDFLALHVREDIKLKVEARLQGIFGKTLLLSWSQNGLRIFFKSTSGGTIAYGGGAEASGLTQMVALLAALYDDEIKFLLIDEPEVSLHPQLQSFILREIKNVAGHPDTPGKKIIVISTHSPSMLPLKSVTDLTSILFFKENIGVPTQIAPADPILANPNLANLIVRISELYKIAFFSRAVILSEGITEEIVVGSLIDKFDDNFHSNGNQLVSVSGKNELEVADKLYNLFGKKTCVLADLDVLDDGTFINYTDSRVPVGPVGGGFATALAQYTDANNDIDVAIAGNMADVIAGAQTQSYWHPTKALMQKRAVLSYLLTATVGQIAVLNNSVVWQAIRTKYVSLLDILDQRAVFLVRKGTIEDCYFMPGMPGGLSKPMKASLEAGFLQGQTTVAIAPTYEDAIKAINFIKLRPKVDEAWLLRSMLGSVLGTIWATISPTTTNQDIQAILEGRETGLSKIFRITKTVAGGIDALNIEIISPLFSNHPSPIQHLRTEPFDVLQNRLPSQ